MKKIFLTSGLAIMIAGSAFADANDINYDGSTTPPSYALANNAGDPSCQQPTLGIMSGSQTFHAKWRPISYNVTYNPGTARNVAGNIKHTPNGTAVTKTGAGVYDSPYAILSNTITSLGNEQSDAEYFSQTGYNFSGWRADYNINTTEQTPLNADYTSGGTLYNPVADNPVWKLTHGVNLYAQWEPIKYRVAYQKGAHGTIAPSANVINPEGYYLQPGAGENALTYDEKYTPLTAAQVGLTSDTGYTFRGWSRDQNDTAGSNTIWAAGTPTDSEWTEDIQGMLNLYAIYSPKQYLVRYHVGAHAASGVEAYNDETATYDQNYTALTGGGENAAASETHIYAAPGYTFRGWSKNQNSVYTGTSADNDWIWTGETPWQINQELGVYAIYSANTYTVTYHAGTAKNRSGNLTHTPSYPTGASATVSDTATYDANYETQENSGCLTGLANCDSYAPYYSQTGYKFTGWRANYNINTTQQTPLNADYTANGTLYGALDTIQYKLTHGVDLYAQWAPKTYSVHYSNGNCGAFASTTGLSGIKSPYDGQPYQIDGYQQWYYTVPSDANNALEYESIYTPLTPAQVGFDIRPGYHFTGWSTTPAGLEMQNNPASVTSTYGAIISGGTPMSSVWSIDLSVNGLDLEGVCEPDQYTLTYECGSYENALSKPPVAHKEAKFVGTFVSTHSFTYTYNATGATAYQITDVCSLNGYHPYNNGTDDSQRVNLLAWQCTNTTTGQSVPYTTVTSANWSVLGNVTCTTGWTPNSISLEWRPGDGATALGGGTYSAGNNTGSCTYDLGINIGAVPSKTGYTFNGWTIDPNSPEVIDSAINNSGDGN